MFLDLFGEEKSRVEGVLVRKRVASHVRARACLAGFPQNNITPTPCGDLSSSQWCFWWKIRKTKLNRVQCFCYVVRAVRELMVGESACEPCRGVGGGILVQCKMVDGWDSRVCACGVYIGVTSVVLLSEEESWDRGSIETTFNERIFELLSP